MEKSTTGLKAGMTWRSLCAMLFGMLVMGMAIQYTEVVQSHSKALAEQSVSLPAILVLVLLLALSAASVWVTRRKLLSRPELLCVLYALLIAAPMMTQGMWHRFFGLISAVPREGQFQYIDALSDKLWPHGPDLLAGALKQEGGSVVSRGNLQWQRVDLAAGRTDRVPVLMNHSADASSAIALVLPVDPGGKQGVVPGNPYLVSVLVRAQGLSAQSAYFVRLYADDADRYTEVLSGNRGASRTLLHDTGFVRVGKYGVSLPEEMKQSVRLEIGLRGMGELAVADPRLMSVAALEGAFAGRRIVDEQTYKALPLTGRAGLVVKPDTMWSLAGLWFWLSGYIPLSEWVNPAIAWSGLIGLLLTGLFGLAVVLRKQWAERERYPFPLARIPMALVGEADEVDDPSPWSRVWKNRMMWAGAGVGLVWGLLRMWAFYNPKVPDTSVDMALSQYFADPGWGEMWQRVHFSLSAVVISICVFFELNVLISFVVGFFAFRALFWVGEISELKVYAGYPFRYEQSVGAYLAYGLLVVFLMRRYLWRVVRIACSRRNRALSGEEPITYRTALLLLLGAHVGIVLWAWWVGVSPGGVFLYFVFLMLVGFVATKIRCECGLPAGYFTPYNAMLFLTMLGGMRVFGPASMMVCLLASGFMTVSVFFFIPGTQLELVEYGRRCRVKRRDLGVAVLLGILGGLFIGGWVFLSNSYALGGANLRYQWAYNQGWFFSSFKAELSEASRALSPDAPGATGAGGAASWAYLYGGGITVILAVLRQLFPGFWFHPVGFMLGSAHMMEWVWGSVLVAFLIRATVLAFGGASTVKRWLFPFFVGVFVGSLGFVVINVVYGAVLQTQGIERIYRVLP